MVPNEELVMAKTTKTEERKRINISMSEDEYELLEKQATKDARKISGLAKLYVMQGLAGAAGGK